MVRELRPPFQGSLVIHTPTQGVALGSGYFAPLGLKTF